MNEKAALLEKGDKSIHPTVIVTEVNGSESESD